jgi:hypothetical protein
MWGNRTLFGMVAVLAIVGSVLVAGGPKEGASLAGARAPAAGGPSAEGITVHGHWTLDIFHADGILDRSIEFENALTTGGAGFLAQFLGRVRTPGNRGILIGDESEGNGPCLGGSGNCVLFEPDVSVDTSDVANGHLTISADFTVENDANVSRVRTTLVSCLPSTPPDSCTTGDFPGGSFTEKLASDSTSDEFDPVPVQLGQLVHVSVTLSFS